MREFLKMISVLFTACAFAGASLAVVNKITREPIARWEKQMKDIALKEVFADAEEFKELTPGKVWEARREGQKAGCAFLTRVQGYSGAITIMFGIGVDGAVTGIRVLSHTETPGLGAKIASEKFREQFKNKSMENLALKKDSPGKGQIDAITGATISSRAVTKALYSTLDSFNKEKGGESK